MLQKYKLPFIVRPSKASLMHLFAIGFFLMGFQGCRVADIQSYATDDAYFSLSDFPPSDYVPLYSPSFGLLSDTMLDAEMRASPSYTRDAFGNLIISSGEPGLYYEDYYDFSYSARIRRFSSGPAFPDYFSPWYTEHYWFSNETPYWGTSIYETVPWNWYGYGSPHHFAPQSWWLNSVFSPFAWPNSFGYFGFSGHSGSGWNGNSGSIANPVLFRKRMTPPTLQSSFSGFSYSGRPAFTPGKASSSDPEVRPARSIPPATRSSSEPAPVIPITRPASTTRPPLRGESTPVNSASRFDNRKENGLIKEDVPASNPRRVPAAPATNTGRKVTFGEGSRSVPRSSPPPMRSTTPSYSPPPRSNPAPRPSGSSPQRQAAPVRSTPSGQRPR